MTTDREDLARRRRETNVRQMEWNGTSCDKRPDRLLRAGDAMSRLRFIDAEQVTAPTTLRCRVLAVSRAGSDGGCAGASRHGRRPMRS